MDWTIVKEFIKPELLILGVFLYCVGMLLKLYPKFTKEWQIPFIVTLVSVVLTPLYMVFILKTGWSGEVIVSGLIQGVLLSALCVFANQIYKQLTEKKD